MPIEKVTEQDGQSANIIDENIEQMKVLFPDAFTEGADGEQKVDFAVLRQLLGDASVLDEGEEKYGLNWHGKKQARQIALTPSTGTLLPCPEESVDWDTTQNLFIEGDNLEVLKLLQKSYANKVKMIYIDPPYNTENDFIYPDNFSEGLESYLQYTGQKADSGWTVSESGREKTGRKHTNWLSMMYPRLKLAKDLLRPDGIIFVSIDDHELGNLKQICDDVFGEENCIENFVWHKKNSAKGVPPRSMVVNIHEYILCYSKSPDAKLVGEARTEDTFANPDNDPRGLWRRSNIKSTLEKSKDKFTIVDPDTGNEFTNYWAYSKPSLEKMIEEGRILFPKKPEGLPKQKEFLEGFANPNMPIMSHLGLFHSQDSSEKAVDQLMEIKSFLYRKPVQLMERIVQQSGMKDDCIVLDFFAGSGTTAHAVMQANLKDGGNRRHVSVQLPEKIDKESEASKLGYQSISDIGKERIKRAASKIREDNPVYDGDLGFRVFKLNSSNINAWNPDRTDLEATLLSHKEHLVEGRSEQDVLYELLLKRGIELTVPIEEKEAAGKTIYSIGYGVLFACLDTSIDKDDVDAVASAISQWHKELEPETDSHVFFRDSAFADDCAKSNMVAILEQNGIAHVRSL